MTDEAKSDPLADLQRTFGAIDKDIGPQNNRTIFIGVTGAGKSTTFNWMLHDLEYCFKDEDEYDKVTYQRADGQPFKSVIHAGYFSKTKCPISEGIYTDCPGFEDTNENAQAILNAYSIDRLLRTTKKVKIVLVSSWAELDAGRATPFVNVLRRLGRIFSKDIHVVAGSIRLIISKIAQSSGGMDFSPQTNIGRIRKKLKSIDEDLKANGDDTNAKKILACLIDATKNNVGLFTSPPIKHDWHPVDPTQTEKNAIQQMLENTSDLENISPTLIIDMNGFQELQKFYRKCLSNTLPIIHEIYAARHDIVRDFVLGFDELKESASKLRKIFGDLGKSIAISNPQNVQSFLACLQTFYDKSNEVLPESQMSQIQKSINTFEFVRKLGIGLEGSSNDLHVDCAKQILKMLNELASYFSAIGQKTLESIDSKLRLSGYIVGTSDLYEAGQNQVDGKTDIDIFSLHSFLVDKGIRAHGANLTCLAPYWFKKSDLEIDLSGGNGALEIGPNSDGEGIPGNPGLPGGHFYSSYKEVFGKGTLKVISNGGNGSDGTRGSDGPNGKDGVEIPEAEFVEQRQKKGVLNLQKVVTWKFAERGEKGGRGFSGGAKGRGGIKGTITFKDWPGVNIIAQNGNDGNEGEPGDGGLGGKYPDLLETYEEYDEIAFGAIESTPWRIVTQIGLGVLTIGIVPAVAGISAYMNTYRTNSSNEHKNETTRAPRGDPGQNTQIPNDPPTRSMIEKKEKQLKYYALSKKNGDKGVELSF